MALAGGVLVEKTAPRAEVVAALECRAAQVRKAREVAGTGLQPDAATESAHGLPTGSLGNTADFVLTSPPVQTVLVCPSTVKAWYLRSIGRELLKKHGIERRMRWCGRRITRNAQSVSVWARPDRAYGRVAGICVCGQSVCCPVCAPRIAAFRAEEVSEAFRRAAESGWEARLETFTKPHKLDRAPNALLREFRDFSGLWRSYQKNADRREKFAEGHQLAREVNWSEANGWHYHHHRLRYDLPGRFEPDLARAQWLAVLEGAGLRSDGAERYAYDCGVVGTEAGARYVAKLAQSVEAQRRAIGSEIASAATKGRNINTLLADYAAGDLNAGATWVNGVACVTATKVSSVRWSRGLRDKLLMTDGHSDEQIAAEEVVSTDEYLGELTPVQWSGVLRWRAEFCLLVAANKGREAVNEFLAGLELGTLDRETSVPDSAPDSGVTNERIQQC
jgi:hypothetical protein